MAYEERLEAVSFAARPAVVGRYLGELLMALGLLTALPAAVSLVFGEGLAAAALAAGAAVAFGLGALLRRIQAPDRIQTNEGMVIAASIFALAPLVAVAAFMIATRVGFVDALFEAVSAVTTTGLTTLASVDGQPRGFLFTRAWMQWYGGVGIVTLAMPLLGAGGLSARRMAWDDEEPAPDSIRARARNTIAVYSGLTVLGMAAMLAAGAGPFDGVVHTLAAVSTGGFSSHDASLAALPSWSAGAVAIALGLCGAVSLPLYRRVARHGPRVLLRDVELRALLVGSLVLSGLLGAAMVLESGMTAGEALRSAPLLATSAQTTTGFTPVTVAGLGPSAKLLMVGSMLSGGGVGSTAGGIKLLRVLIAFRLLQWAVSRARLAPHAVSEPHLAGEVLGNSEIQRALVVILLFLGVVGLSWLTFVACGYDPLDSLFEVASAAGTVGLSAGIARPELETPLKLVLCANMLLGRVEILALIVVLSPGTWWGRRRTA